MSAPFSRGMLQKIWKCLNGAGCFVFRTRVIRTVRQYQTRFFIIALFYTFYNHFFGNSAPDISRSYWTFLNRLKLYLSEYTMCITALSWVNFRGDL